MVHKDLEKFERTKTAGTTMPAIFQLRSRYTIAASQAALGSFYRWACRAVLFSACAVTAASRLTGASSRVAAAEDPAESAALDDAAASRKTQQEVMVARGFVRSRGAWRTVQEIELIERAERANLAQKEWNLKLGRLRKQLEQPLQADRAAEEIREISDRFAVPALATALSQEPSFRVRSLYVEALSRIRSSDATTVLIATAIDHSDPETRIAATERLIVIGPHQALPAILSALAGSDNARINRAAEVIGRLGVPSAVSPLINALETQHIIVVGSGAEGATSATFTPSGGGLSMGSGKKNSKVSVQNERVLQALVTLTGVNFEWNRSAWRAWLANRQSPPDFDPRRG